MNHLLPGRIDTDRVRELDTIRGKASGASADDVKAAYSKTIPLGRYGEADEFATAAVFLFSDAARYITGASLQVDGGLIRTRLLQWQLVFDRFVRRPMKVYLVNPSDVSFGIAVITPRWLFVLAAATPAQVRRPDHRRRDARDASTSAAIEPGDIVGVGIHTGNALRGYEVGRARARRRRDRDLRRHSRHAVPGRGPRARARRTPSCAATATSSGAQRARRRRGGHAAAAVRGRPRRRRCVRAGALGSAAPGSYMWASVQTVRGCPKHCSFCSVWRTDGQEPRMRTVDAVLKEIVELRRKGFRFIALADDNFYPVALKDLEMADAPRGQDPAARAARRCAPSASS